MSDTMVANMDEIQAQIKASFNRSKEFLYQDPLHCHLYGYSELEHNLKQLRKHIFLDSAESLLEKITRWKRSKSSSLSDYNSHRGKYIIDKMDNFLDKYDFNPLTPKVIRNQTATYPYRQNSDEDFDSANYKSTDNVKNNILIENELMNKDSEKSEHQGGNHSNNCKHSLPPNSYPPNRTENKSRSKSDIDLPIKVENVENNHKTTGYTDTLRSNIVVGHSKFYVPTFEEFKRIHKQNSLPPKPERLIGLKRDDSFSKEFDTTSQELCQVDRYTLKERIECKCIMGVDARYKLIKSSSLNSGMDDSDNHYWRNLQRTNSLDRLSFDSLSKWDQYGNLMTSLETHIKSENPTRPKIIHRCFLEGKIRKNPQKTVEKRNNIINIKHFQTNKSPDIEKTKTFDSFHLHSKWGDLSRGGSSDNLPHHFSEKSRMYAYQMDRTDSTKSLNSMESASSSSHVKLGTLAHKYISKNEKHPKLQRSNSERIRRGGNEVEVENVLAFYKKMSDKIARLKEPFSYRTESKEQKTIPSLGSPVMKSKFSKSPLSLSRTNKIPNKKINYTYSDFVPFEKRVAVSPSEKQTDQLFNDQTKSKSASLNENKLFKQRHLEYKSSHFSIKRTHNNHSEKPVPEKIPLPKIYLEKYVNLDNMPTSDFQRDCKSIQNVSDVLEISSSQGHRNKKTQGKHLVQAEFTDKIESASSSGVSSVTSSDSKQFGSEDANQDLETGNLQIGHKNDVLSSEDNGVAMETIQIFQENFEVVICSDCDQNFERLQNEKIFHCRSCQKNRIERKKTILEILETERRYGRDLKIMKQEFYRPMKTANLLSLEQLEAVFGNLDDLITVNEKFVDKLMEALDFADKERDEDFCTVSIGKVFQEVTPMFLVFEEYCVKQASASVLLSTLEKEKDILRIFLQVSQAENSALRRMNLSSFLIVPVQRITRYPLLLNRVHSATPYCHIDRVAIKEAVMKVESHLEHINMHTNGNGGSKLKRKISNAAKKNMQVEHIELRKIALDALGWQHSDTEQVLSGKLLYTQPTDHLWAKRGKVLKFCPVHALLLRTGKILEEKPPRDNQLMFRGITGIDDAALILIKEKNGRLMPLREPFHLDKCVVAIDPDFDEVFEVQELSTKDVYLIKAEDFKNTQEWVKQLKLHAWDRGAWRKRRPALANIMMSNTVG